MLMRRWPLWLQLTSAMVVASLAVAMVAGRAMRAIETDYLRDELRRESLRTSEALTMTFARPALSGNDDELRRLLEGASRADAQIHSVALIDDAGRSVGRWVVGEVEDPAQVFYFRVPTAIPQRGQGQLVVSWNVAGLMRNIQEHVSRLQVNMFFTVGLLSGVLVVLVHFLVIRPVDRLRHGLDRLSGGESDSPIRLSWLAASELDRLAHSLTELGRHQRALSEARFSLEHARQAAEAASEAKGRFLAVMSHEIRTPINGIVGSLDLLRDVKLNATEASLVAGAQRSADSLLEIINEILDFSRVESGHIELETVEFQFESQLNDVASGMTGLVDPSRVELVVDVDPAIPGRVRGDPLRLRQVLTNLLGNAAKFTETGSIVLRARPVGDMRVCIQVQDTGIGVPADRQASLFDPFIQADSSTTRQYGGTGLGLSIVKQLVELMGGVITLDSTPDSGSTFSVELPMETVEPARAFELPHLVGQPVLVVEDNEYTSQALCRYLRSLAAVPMPAKDSDSAFAAAQPEARYLLVDAELAARQGGAGFVHGLRAACADAETLVVMLIAPGTVVPADAVFDVTLLKPVKRDSLALALADTRVVASPVQAAAGQPTPQGVRGRVLVVDDNPMNVQVAVAMLERLCLQADTAASGGEALERIAQCEYDVVLMDEQMPGMDGLETTRKLRMREAGAAGTPVVALTANADEKSEQRCLDSGMDGFLAKPVRRRALRDVLARWIADLPAVEGTSGAS